MKCNFTSYPVEEQRIYVVNQSIKSRQSYHIFSELMRKRAGPAQFSSGQTAFFPGALIQTKQAYYTND